MDLIKIFPEVRVSWSINTLDETFRKDTDNAVSIERRLAAMKASHSAGVRMMCFISPIYPGITDVPSIIRAAKARCNLIWLENLNLWGGYKKAVLDYIAAKRPDLAPIYQAVYLRGERSYWAELDKKTLRFTMEEGLLDIRYDDSLSRPFETPPVVVNSFFYEEIIPSAKRKIEFYRWLLIKVGRQSKNGDKHGVYTFLGPKRTSLTPLRVVSRSKGHALCDWGKNSSADSHANAPGTAFQRQKSPAEGTARLFRRTASVRT